MTPLKAVAFRYPLPLNTVCPTDGNRKGIVVCVPPLQGYPDRGYPGLHVVDNRRRSTPDVGHTQGCDSDSYPLLLVAVRLKRRAVPPASSE